MLMIKEYIYSPWKLSKTSSLLVVPNDSKKEWNDRLECLKGHIQYWINNQSDKMIETIQLYYNQSNTVDIDNIKKVEVIDNTSKFCVDCGKGISKNANRCLACAKIYYSKVKERPPLEQILKDLETMGSFKAVGEHYDVNDNTVRKWLTVYKYEVKCQVCQTPVKSFGKMCSECKKNRIPSLKQLETDYKELKTYKEIATKYDVTRDTIRFWFEKRRSEIKDK